MTILGVVFAVALLIALIAILRVLENPSDELAWFRTLQMIEGVGPATARRIMDAIGVGTGSGASPLDRLVDEPAGVPAPAFEAVAELRQPVDQGRCTGEGREEEQGEQPDRGSSANAPAGWILRRVAPRGTTIGSVVAGTGEG